MLGENNFNFGLKNVGFYLMELTKKTNKYLNFRK